MEITKFKKLNDNRYRVYIKDSDDLILFDDVIVKYNLLVNKVLDDKTSEEIINYNNELLGYYKAIKYLGIKMRSKKELRDYLKKQDLSKKVIDNTIAKLVKDGYIDDQKYAKAYVIDQINLTLNGPEKIKTNLKKLDVNEEYIDNELNAVSNDIWHQRVEKIIFKKQKSNKNSRQLFIKKMSQYLYTQGYYKEQYLDILNNIDLNDETNFMKDANLLFKKLQRKYQDEELYYYLKNKLYVKGYSSDTINEYIETLKKES